MNRRAAVILAATFFAYIVTVLQRSSLGVAAVDATERYDVAATVLSMLAVSQLIVYAAMQVPVGVLIDRLGPRIPLLAGAALMAIGQATVAVSDDIGVAILGRMLVGAGDATTFGAGIRLFASWLPARSVPITTQIYGVLGQVGQLLSAIPFMVLLHAVGWTPAFLSAAGLSVIAFAAVLGATTVAGTAPYAQSAHRVSLRQTLSHLMDALRRPGTQIGFWAHFISQCSQTTFVLLWGFPFLTVSIGLPASTATAIISVSVVTGFVAGPLLGILSARFPTRRSNIVLGIVFLIAVTWAVVLTWPGVPPTWLLVLLVVVISVGGPASLIGFDYARTYNPMRQLGSANGVVNVGGFLASFTAMFFIGVVLDALDPSDGRILTSLYSLDSFRVAFLIQYVLIGFGAVMLLITRKRIRRSMFDDEGIVVAPLWLAIARSIRRQPPPEPPDGDDGPDSQPGMR